MILFQEEIKKRENEGAATSTLSVNTPLQLLPQTSTPESGDLPAAKNPEDKQSLNSIEYWELK